MNSRGIPEETGTFNLEGFDPNQTNEEWEAIFDRKYAEALEANLREQHPISTPFTVYRLYDHDWAVAYVGITKNFNSRIYAHMCDKWWFVDIDMGVVVSDHFATAEEASLFEIKLITELDPLYNVAGADRAYSKYKERQDY